MAGLPARPCRLLDAPRRWSLLVRLVGRCGRRVLRGRLVGRLLPGRCLLLCPGMLGVRVRGGLALGRRPVRGSLFGNISASMRALAVVGLVRVELVGPGAVLLVLALRPYGFGSSLLRGCPLDLGLRVLLASLRGENVRLGRALFGRARGARRLLPSLLGLTCRFFATAGRALPQQPKRDDDGHHDQYRHDDNRDNCRGFHGSTSRGRSDTAFSYPPPLESHPGPFAVWPVEVVGLLSPRQ